MRVVGEYKPTMYGFKGYRKGLKPSDYALGKPCLKARRAPIAPKEAGQAKTAANSDRPLAATLAPRPLPPSSSTFQLNPGDHIAIIGNALADRMQHDGWLETLIHAKYPEAQTSSSATSPSPATRSPRGTRSENFGTPDEWLTKVQGRRHLRVLRLQRIVQGRGRAARSSRRTSTSS